MKHTKVIAIFFATYHIASFSAEHQLHPALKTMINKTVIIEREYTETQHQKQTEYYMMVERENYINNYQRIIEYNNQFPKISQEELDAWVTKKELEIKENQTRYKKEQEQRELKYYQEYYRKNRRQRSPYLKTIKKDLKNDHQNRYNPQIKTIECYPTRLLLEWKK